MGWNKIDPPVVSQIGQFAFFKLGETFAFLQSAETYPASIPASFKNYGVALQRPCSIPPVYLDAAHQIPCACKGPCDSCHEKHLL